MPIAEHPLHRSGQAALPHPAPTLGDDAQAHEGIEMADMGGRKRAVEDGPHPPPGQMIALTATPQHVPPQATDRQTEGAECRAIHGHAVVAHVTENDRAQVSADQRDGIVHARAQLGQKPLSLDAMLESNDTVISPAYDDDIAARLLLPPSLDPQVKHIVKVDIGQERTDAPALNRTDLTLDSFPILQHTGGKPFLDQPHDALIRHTSNPPLGGAWISRLNTQPARSPVNASPPTLQSSAHDSGPSWMANPSMYDTFNHNTSPV